MKTKFSLLVTVLATALFGAGCASVKVTEEQLQSGLIAYYPFNGNAMDVIGNGHDGEVKRAKLTKDRFGNATSAYAFDGLYDHINCGHDEAMNAFPLTLSV